MTIPYRTQRVIKRILTALLAVALVLAAGFACWFVWLQRYVVYSTDGGVRLDFNLAPMQPGEPAVQPEEMDVTIHFDTDDEMVTSTEFVKLDGYYVEPEAMGDLPAVKAQIQALPAGTAVMVDVKSTRGDFYYSSAVSSNRSNKVNTQQMDELISYLKKSNVYAIARIPALRDYHYGLNNVPDGVHHSSGGYLHMDDDGCYWLHPGSQGTITYLTQIITELKSLGFDEVVLDDFSFPPTDNIQVNGDRGELLSKAAGILLSACATDRFAVSFVKSEEFTAPQGRSRVYLEGLDAIQAGDAAQNSGVADMAVNLVFLTELHDTRFDVYSVMRPLSGAH